MNQFGYIDIENDEIDHYNHAVKKKIGICEILPGGRFALCRDGVVRFCGLVCSDKMGGRQTGVSAVGCRNCDPNWEKP